MTEIDYKAILGERGDVRAEKPMPPSDRHRRLNSGMNTALHGAGSAVDARQLASPRQQSRYQDRRDAGNYGYGGEELPPRSAGGRDEFGRSVKAVAWLHDILTSRVLPAKPGWTSEERTTHALMLLESGQMTQKQVSVAIDAFKDCPRKDALGVHPAAEESDLDRVVAYLRGRMDAGTINEFGQSLLEQYEARGTLSERQIEAMLRGMPSKSEEALKEAPEPLPVVPDGRYAVDNAAGELTFYRVKVARSGRTFIHLKYGPNEGEVPFTWAGYRTILQSIVDVGPYEAALRYARELGRCSVCDLDLTNRLSRELGIGPVCGGRFHDADSWKAIKADARAVIRARGEDPNEAIA